MCLIVLGKSVVALSDDVFGIISAHCGILTSPGARDTMVFVVLSLSECQVGALLCRIDLGLQAEGGGTIAHAATDSARYLAGDLQAQAPMIL